MQPSRAIKIMICIVAISVVAICSFNFSGDNTTSTDILSRYRSATQNNLTTVNSVTSVINSGAYASSNVNSVNTPGVATDTDLREMAKVLSGPFGYPGKCYYQSTGHATEPSVTYTYKGATRTLDTGLVRSDCTGFCSAMLYLMGIDSTYVSRYSGSFLTWGSEVSASTFNDVEVGDILVYYRDIPGGHKGHGAMVVYKDDQYVYMGDWGGNQNIRATKDNGYYEFFELSEPISNWRENETVHVRRAAQ